MRIYGIFAYFFPKRKYMCLGCGVHGEMDQIKDPAMKCPKCGHWTVKFLN